MQEKLAQDFVYTDNRVISRTSERLDDIDVTGFFVVREP